MILGERIFHLSDIMEDIADTNSMIEKRRIIRSIPEELKDDFECVVECLSGVHKFGYTYPDTVVLPTTNPEILTVRDAINYLLRPAKTGDLSLENIYRHVSATSGWWYFFGPIVNRTMKIGIGKSILPKDGLSAMLAKKYDERLDYSKSGYFITEKLDGNRCIARYDGTKWVFTSRNGKPMHVDFDMGDLPKEFVYDGEILSPGQVQTSKDIEALVLSGQMSMFAGRENLFNSTSGLINRHDTNKNLIYNVFDIMVDSVPYWQRREELEKLTFSGDTRLVPVLYTGGFQGTMCQIPHLLGDVTDLGGEGIMINVGDATYQHKRTSGLLKVKKVQTIDMRVKDIQWGTGKYVGQVGAIICECNMPDGKVVRCDVGTGLSDEQRLSWAIHPEKIIDKIVEVAYFSLSQSSTNSGTNQYSLRFPRLKRVREDKNETSIH